MKETDKKGREKLTTLLRDTIIAGMKHPREELEKGQFLKEVEQKEKDKVEEA